MSLSNASTRSPAPRVPLAMPVVYRRSYARRDESGQLKNISLTGAFLKTDDPMLGIEDKVVITLAVSGRRRTIPATVVWKNEAGCGLQFHPFNNRDVQIVDDLMYFVENSRKSRRSVLEDIFKRVS